MQAAYESYLQMHGSCGIQHYAVNLILYLRTMTDKYIEINNKFISQLYIYAKAVRILAKDYLPVSLITPFKLQEIIDSIKEMLFKTNPDYDIVIKRLHLYYDMKLVTLRIDRKRNLIIQFPIFVQPYIQQTLILYQLETVPVPIVLDGGNEIILANWPSDKHIFCTINNDIPVEIPSHPYVLVNSSVLCNCGTEAENNFLLESLATCHDANTNLVMYFTVNMAFTNYIDQCKLTEESRVSYFN